MQGPELHAHKNRELDYSGLFNLYVLYVGLLVHT